MNNASSKTPWGADALSIVKHTAWPKTYRLLLGFVLAFGWVGISLGLRADKIVLKSGGTLEGTIHSESETQIQIEVAAYERTIFSTRTIPKAEVSSIRRDSPQ